VPQHEASIRKEYGSKVWRHVAQGNLHAEFIRTKAGGTFYTQNAKRLNKRAAIYHADVAPSDDDDDDDDDDDINLRPGKTSVIQPPERYRDVLS
jgi:hypothetical protein